MSAASGHYRVSIVVSCTIASAEITSDDIASALRDDQRIIAPSLRSNPIKEIKHARNKALEEEFVASLQPGLWIDAAQSMAASTILKRQSHLACDGAIDPALAPLTSVRPNRLAKFAASESITEAIKHLETRGGIREGAGRPVGSLGKAERERLLKKYRWALSQGCEVSAQLTLRELKSCQAYYHQKESEWTKAALRKANYRGYKGSQARVKVNQWRLARDEALEAMEIEKVWLSSTIGELEELLLELKRTTGDHPLIDELRLEVDTELQHLSASQESKLQIRAQALRLFYKLIERGVDRDIALEDAGDTFIVRPDTLRKWEADYRVKQKLPISQQGRAEKRFLLHEEDLMQECIEFVKEHSNLKGVANMTAADFQKFVNASIMPKLAASASAEYNPFKGLRVSKAAGEDGLTRYEIGERTAVVWLKKLGFSFRGNTKGVYYDGHDRQDVLDYRKSVYLVEYYNLRLTAEVWYKVSAKEATELLNFDQDWVQKRLERGKDDDALEENELWLCIEDIEDPLDQHPEWLRSRLTHRKLLPNGKTALFLFQDESIYKGKCNLSADSYCF